MWFIFRKSKFRSLDQSLKGTIFAIVEHEMQTYTNNSCIWVIFTALKSFLNVGVEYLYSTNFSIRKFLKYREPFDMKYRNSISHEKLQSWGAGSISHVQNFLLSKYDDCGRESGPGTRAGGSHFSGAPLRWEWPGEPPFPSPCSNPLLPKGSPHPGLKRQSPPLRPSAPIRLQMARSVPYSSQFIPLPSAVFQRERDRP